MHTLVGRHNKIFSLLLQNKQQGDRAVQKIGGHQVVLVIVTPSSLPLPGRKRRSGPSCEPTANPAVAAQLQRYLHFTSDVSLTIVNC